MKRKTCICDICFSEISLSNIKNHRNSKTCLSGRKTVANHIKSCKFCFKEYNTPSGRGLHEIQCSMNPNKRNIQEGRTAWNSGLTKETDFRVLKAAQVISDGITSGRIKLNGIGNTEWYANGGKEILVANGKKNGGYKPNAGRSKKYKVFDSFGNQVTLQSSYEYAVFDILRELGIKWVRPKALKYDGRNYFADFYLPNYNIWLDPKNDYKAKRDEEKIRKVIEQNKVKLFILLQHQISKEYIGRLAEMD